MKKSNAGHEINRVNFGYKYTKRIFSMSIWMLFIFSFFIPQKNIYAASENILTKPERWLKNVCISPLIEPLER